MLNKLDVAELIAEPIGLLDASGEFEMFFIIDPTLLKLGSVANSPLRFGNVGKLLIMQKDSPDYQLVH